MTSPSQLQKERQIVRCTKCGAWKKNRRTDCWAGCDDVKGAT